MIQENLLPNDWYWQVVLWAEGRDTNDGIYHRSREVGSTDLWKEQNTCIGNLQRNPNGQEHTFSPKKKIKHLGNWWKYRCKTGKNLIRYADFFEVIYTVGACFINCYKQVCNSDSWNDKLQKTV